MSKSASLSYTLVITGAPYSSQAPQTAFEFASALLQAGHSIDRVFLYGDGVHLASALSCAPSDETNWTRSWCAFLSSNKVPAIVCVASALRRGILDETEQKRYQKDARNLVEPFEIAGLGEWVDGLTRSSRTLYFNAAN